MPWIQAHDDFNPDRCGRNVVGIAAAMREHDSGTHQHAMGQLLFTQHGCIRITLDRQLCMLPPTRVAWIPPETSHRAQMTASVGYRSVYFDTKACSGLPSQPVVMGVTDLLRAVLERMATAAFDTDWQQGPGAHWLAVCIDEIATAQREPMLLPLPMDRRLQGLNTDTLPPQLHALAATVGASEKTIGRIFQRETGMGYRQWRQQWRLLKSIELLAVHPYIAPVASELGFASDTAFIAFFKTMTGHTPRDYLSLQAPPA